MVRDEDKPHGQRNLGITLGNSPMSTKAIYRDAPSMELLMPEKGREILADLTADIFREAGKLSGSHMAAKLFQI